ncbi:multisubunit sodium/proton antiporter, MrpD subunit (TC 2.A.63.1) [Geoalkalibacter ferrihydriticus]|uniref:Monovalent cation/H+ antiporter subunit D n=2 Tax=Geoalkalibacter ferrihydriticus TaxID=392333 RepID=A0A0C2HGN4_9BACT|nr:monovalent cation/H+ antiporter subunit D family protein [Geoalkalibacter ferrihydriticus]KIH76111.1 monovalent cation/H+ antiporter subunit D [Geoalkalibacter ferrihydriticus DSM 17813]SDM44971.1 multisubunit sodium/proton antiporter, MrpD subunit (TC 2.A.63.1) [Geoalkalibacter ferrihydriticus]
MEPIITSKVLLATLIPMVTGALVMATGRSPNLRESCSFVGAVLTFISVLMLAPTVLAGGGYALTLVTLYPGISVSFYLDPLGLIFAGTASFLWILASIYCIGYMRGLNEHAQTRFYVCYAVSVGAAMGAAFSANLFTLYLFYEIVSIFTYPLVMHHQDKEGYAGARKYLIYLMFTSKAFLLPAMALVYVLTGTLDFNMAGIASGIFPAEADRLLVIVAYLLCLFGFAKAGIMPFHNWLPDAMVAPTPVSALLHAVVVVKVGVFSICRVMLSVFGIDLLDVTGLGMFTAYFVSFTILAASVIALTQTNLKARLAYSTVSQLSYIVLGVAMLTPHAITGGLLHIANHAFAKITLFFAAGAIYVASGKKDISELGGLGWRMPLTLIAFGLASLSMIGAPPVSGFVTKWYLALGAMDAGSLVLLVVLLASGLLNAGYFVPIFYKAFFAKPLPGDEATGSLERQPLVLLMVVPLVITGLISVLIGIWPDLFLNTIKLMVGS